MLALMYVLLMLSSRGLRSAVVSRPSNCKEGAIGAHSFCVRLQHIHPITGEVLVIQLIITAKLTRSGAATTKDLV